MTDVRALVSVALAAALGLSPRVAASDDLTTRWYDEVRDLIEDLAKRDVGRGIAEYLAIHEPEACFYLSGTLDRMQSGYWGGVPGGLREDALRAIGDFIFFAVRWDHEPSLGGTAGSFRHAAAATYKPFADRALGNKDRHVHTCSAEWWQASSTPKRVLPSSYASLFCRQPADSRARLACAISQTTIAYLRGDQAAVKQKVTELAVELVSEAVGARAKNLSNAAKKQLATWLDDPATLKTSMETIRRSLSTDVSDLLAVDTTKPCPAVLDVLRRLRAHSDDIVAKSCLVRAADRLDFMNVTLSIGDTSSSTFFDITDQVLVELVGKAKQAGIAATTDPKVCKGAAHYDVNLRLFGEDALLRLRDTGAICEDSFDDRRLAHFAWDKWGDLKPLRDAVRDLKRELAVGEDEIVAFAQIARDLDKIEHRIESRFNTGLNFSFEMTIEMLRDLMNNIDDPTTAHLAEILDTAQLRTIVEWADRRSYRDLALTLFDSLRANAGLDSVTQSQIDLLVNFVGYVLDSTENMGSDALSRAAFRSAAIDYLSSLDIGLPIKTDEDHWLPRLDQRGWAIPSLSLRWAWNTYFLSQSSSDGFRTVVTANWPRLTFSFSRFFGIQISMLDLFGPVTEVALRKSGTYKGCSNRSCPLLIDLFRPQLDLYFFLPQISRNVAIIAGGGLRYLSVTPDAMPDTYRYGFDTSLEVDLGTLIAF